MFEIVDNDGRGRTDAGPCVYYKLTFDSGELKRLIYLPGGGALAGQLCTDA